MGERIRWIWIISLVAALAAIGMQGYWLYNQLRYESFVYASELAANVRQAGDEEFRLRKERTRTTDVSYVIEQKSTYESNGGATGKKNTFDLKMQSKEGKLPLSFKLNFTVDIPDDSIYEGVDRAVIQQLIPFQAARLDSLLAIRLPGVSYRICPFAESDTLAGQVIPLWKSLPGTVLPPVIAVSYLYAPVDREGVWVEIDLPLNPLLSRMGWQLFLSLFLIILLLVCLGFQIRTIWEQMRLNQLREGFVHTMIHELKRPVQTLKMFVSFLNDKEMRRDEAATEQVLQDSLFELDTLSAYLGKLKDMVHADDRDTLLNLSSFDLRELIAKVIRLTQVPAGKQVSFSTAFPPDMPDITADPVHVANVLSNLIENAIKYSESQVEIQIAVFRDDQQVEIAVSDNGLGISAEERTKVFEKFYRSSRLSDKQIPGIGLGLSYVRQIVEAHQGHVSLWSELGEGTRVNVCLPVHPKVR